MPELTRFLLGLICGEMAVTDIPAAAGIDVDALKSGDDDPMEVLVQIPAGRSTRGWYYTPQALRQIVDAVNESGLPGFLGHQQESEVQTEFPTPVTHWVGGSWDEQEQAAYIRGVIDAAQPDLKRWVRAKSVRQVSIFGQAALEYDPVSQQTLVTGYVPLSIDWTPLNRAGMPTAVVATGEMTTALKGGTTPMTLQELIASLRSALAGGTTIQALAGEMGWTAESLAKALNPEWADGAVKATALVGEIRTALGLTPEADILAKLRELLGAAHDARVDALIRKDVSGEMAQGLVKRMLRTTPDMTDEQIAGEIKALLDDTALKSVLGAAHEDGFNAGKAPAHRDGEPTEVVITTL